MLLPYATGFFLGAGMTLGISFLYFTYKIIPYQRTITSLLKLTKENFNKQARSFESKRGADRGDEAIY